MSHSETNIEGELRKLSLGGAGLFALLVAALIMVMQALGSQLGVFEEKIVPTERAVGGMLDSMGEISAHEAAVLAAEDGAAIDAIGEPEGAGEAAEASLETLEVALERDQLASLIEAFDAFRDSAHDLTDAARDSHEVNDAFAAQLAAAQVQVATLLSRISALEGEVQLRYILLLRELDSSQSTDAVQRLVHGNVRMIDERVGMARTMIEVLGRRIEQVALTRNRDELNSLNSNELAQAAASAKAAIDQLGRSLDATEDADLAAAVASVSTELTGTLGLLHANGATPGLVDLRHAYFDAGATMRAAQAAGRERSLSANATLADVGANVRAVAESSQAKTDAVVRSARVGVALLVLLGLGFCTFSGRRILLALKALRQQNADLAQLKDELSEANTHLEARVEERTKELAAREASTRLLLDSMGEGIFEVDADGCLVGERSKAVDDWFGERLGETNPRVWNVLTKDATQEASIQFGWDQLFDGFLPFEVAADQIPNRFERDGQVFDVEYRMGAQDSTVLVVVRDWTANETAERAERESREFQTLVGNLLKDREGFELTRDECVHLIETLENAAELTETKKALHTLKGNTASYGFRAVADRCHSLEDMIAEEQTIPSEGELAALKEEWESSIDRLKDFLQSDESGAFQVEAEEVEHLCRL
ncbi:MAG: Hpt domain-containing protein, partial [Planctomycetota bacterium]